MAKKSKDSYEILVALETWHNAMPKGPLEPRSPAGIMRRLTEIVWHYNFMPYFRMKKEREKKGGGPPRHRHRQARNEITAGGTVRWSY